MIKNVTLTLSSAEADWLYELLSETFDEGASTSFDERMAKAIADQIDAFLEVE